MYVDIVTYTYVCMYRVARWYIFIPEPPILVHFGGRGLENLDIFYDHMTLWSYSIFQGNLVSFVIICYIFPILVYCIKKYLTPLMYRGVTAVLKCLLCTYNFLILLVRCRFLV
jgi:hypothetical protein